MRQKYLENIPSTLFLISDLRGLWTHPPAPIQSGFLYLFLNLRAHNNHLRLTAGFPNWGGPRWAKRSPLKWASPVPLPPPPHGDAGNRGRTLAGSWEPVDFTNGLLPPTLDRHQRPNSGRTHHCRCRPAPPSRLRSAAGGLQSDVDPGAKVPR